MSRNEDVSAPLLINVKKETYGSYQNIINKANNFKYKNKKKIFLCKCLIITIILITFLFILGCYLNILTTYKYETVFKNVEITSNYENFNHQNNYFQLPKIEFFLRDKNFRIENRIINQSQKYVSTFSYLLNMIVNFLSSPINKIKHDYLYDTYFKIFDQYHNQFKIEKLINNLNQDIKCFLVQLNNDRGSFNQNEFEACFDLGNDSWFGGHESYNQPYWPINNQSFSYVAYVTGYPDDWGAVVERYWLGSSGVSIFIEEDVPLFVQHLEPNRICLKSSNFTPPYKFTSMNNKLQYNICMGNDLKSVHLHNIDNYFGKPKNLPDYEMILNPVFTTWGYFFRNINQSVILDYAKEIYSYNISVSNLEIDDKWELMYGDLDFDKNKFPNVKEMINILHEKYKMRCTLWVHPFCNIDSINFINGTYNEIWVKDKYGKHPAFTEWWNGNNSVILDTTNQKSLNYFYEKLEYLRKMYGIDAFKFDAGETSWIGPEFKLYNDSAYLDLYSQNYVKLALNLSNLIEVRTGHRIQNAGLFYRILDRASDWSIHDGLKSVITQTLQFGILGYPYVLPDIIGGNDGPDKSKKELFIRWTQLTAFMPVMQFGVPPWYFDEETVIICKKLIELHQNYIAPYIKMLLPLGEPIIRPLWWLEPNNTAIFNINDQFLVGNDILVAPVLDPLDSITSRLVYLPPGRWYSPNEKSINLGPKLIEFKNLTINSIPYFLSENFVELFGIIK